jgi:CheY-like chemotaxis protein
MKTILLLEDNLEFANMCVEQLLKNNYDVKFADNPEKAKQIFIENLIDIAIIDLMLPPTYNIEGLDFYRFIKDRKDNIDVIFITTKEFKTTEIVAEAMKLGAKDFLDKENKIFLDKLIFTIKNLDQMTSKSNQNEIKKSFAIIAIYLFLFIVVIGFLLFSTYLITLMGLPFFKSFLIITTVAISIIIVILASQLRYESRISEETWLKVLKSRIVNFPQQLLDKFKRLPNS